MLADWQFAGIFLTVLPVTPAAPGAANWLLDTQNPNSLKQQSVIAAFFFALVAAYEQIDRSAAFRVFLFVLILAVRLGFI